MDWFEALILGLVQGLTEFLPVSSSGHIAIGAHLFGVQANENLTFTITVHAATVLSTIVVLRKQIATLCKGLFAFKWNNETKYVLKICLSMLPVMIVGLFFKDYVEAIFGSGLLVVGICLMITAVLLAFAYYAKPRPKENIGWIDALVIGVAQAIAVLPGLSRSGSTIATGLLLGNKKETIAQFSFLMVLIPILGESLLSLLQNDIATNNLPLSSLSIGFAAAFISGIAACKFMINIVKRGKLIWFAIYCLIAGIIAAFVL